MKQFFTFSIVAVMLILPAKVNSQVKIDLKKQVITIDKNAKANVRKDAPKDQGKDVKQNQGTQDKQVTSEKKDNKSNEELKTNTDSKSATQ